MNESLNLNNLSYEATDATSFEDGAELLFHNPYSREDIRPAGEKEIQNIDELTHPQAVEYVKPVETYKHASIALVGEYVMAIRTDELERNNAKLTQRDMDLAA